MKMPKITASRLRSGRLKVEWSGKGTKMMEAMSFIQRQGQGFRQLLNVNSRHIFYFFKELLYICNENNKY